MITLPAPIEVAPTRNPPTIPVTTAPIRGVIHSGRRLRIAVGPSLSIGLRHIMSDAMTKSNTPITTLKILLMLSP